MISPDDAEDLAPWWITLVDGSVIRLRAVAYGQVGDFLEFSALVEGTPPYEIPLATVPASIVSDISSHDPVTIMPASSMEAVSLTRQERDLLTSLDASSEPTRLKSSLGRLAAGKRVSNEELNNIMWFLSQQYAELSSDEHGIPTSRGAIIDNILDKILSGD